MILSKISKVFSLITLVCIFTGFGLVQAQTQLAPPATGAQFSDEELEQFANAYLSIAGIQEESQYNMAMAIEESNLSMDRFNEMIMQGQQGGEEAIEATEEEMNKFEQALEQVQEIQVEMQTEMMQAIATEGLDVNQFQGIMQAYEHDAEVREKVDNLFAQIHQNMME